MCICVFHFLFVCVCVHLYVYLLYWCRCVHLWRPEAPSAVLFALLFILWDSASSGTSSSLLLWLGLLNWSWEPCLSAPSTPAALGLQTLTNIPDFYMGAEQLNPSLLTCASSAFPHEPPPYLPTFIWVTELFWDGLLVNMLVPTLCFGLISGLGPSFPMLSFMLCMGIPVQPKVLLDEFPWHQSHECHILASKTS